MNNRDHLKEVIQDEELIQSLYNKYMMEITNPEMRQLFTQLRDDKMQNITQLQQRVKTLNDQGQA